MSEKETHLKNEYIAQRTMLYEKALSGVCSPLERTRETLLWRGFLVLNIKNKLYLSAGSPDDDLYMLRQFKLPVSKLRDHFYPHRGYVMNDDFLPAADAENTIPHRDFLAEIEPVTDENILKNLFVAPPVTMGMCGSNEFSGWANNGDWESFQELRFGRKVPVEVLDLGVALLVKTLSLLGLDTVVSCEGHSPWEIRGWRFKYAEGSDYRKESDHGDDVPTISLSSEYHLKWAKHILPKFLPVNDPFVKQWEFQEGSSWFDKKWRLAPVGSITGPDSKFEVFRHIQRLCRGILDSHLDDSGRYDMENSLAHKVREAKRKLTSPRDLDHPDLAL